MTFKYSSRLPRTSQKEWVAAKQQWAANNDRPLSKIKFDIFFLHIVKYHQWRQFTHFTKLLSIFFFFLLKIHKKENQKHSYYYFYSASHAAGTFDDIIPNLSSEILFFFSFPLSFHWVVFYAWDASFSAEGAGGRSQNPDLMNKKSLWLKGDWFVSSWVALYSALERRRVLIDKSPPLPP